MTIGDRIAEDVVKVGNKITYILGKSSGWRVWPKPEERA